MSRLSVHKNYQMSSSGQALLMVLLSLSVVLVVSLSVASRSVTEMKTSTYDEETVRAFSAAEAGIERALLYGTGTFDLTVNEVASNIKYEATSDVLGTSSYNYPVSLWAGETAVFWMVSHDSNNNLTCNPTCSSPSNVRFYWSSDSTIGDQTPAIELKAYYDYNTSTGTVGNAVSVHTYEHVKTSTLAIDPNNGRTASNGFSSGVQSGAYAIDDVDYVFRTQPQINIRDDFGLPNNCLSTDGCLLFLQVKMLYNDNVAVGGKPHFVGANFTGPDLPAQGIKIISTGTSGDSTRKLYTFKQFPELPPIFDNAIFSSNDLIHE